MTARDANGKFAKKTETTEVVVNVHNSSPSDNLPAVPEKALTATQVKNLSKIVEGDMDNLYRRLSNDVDRRTRARITEIEAQSGATTGYETFRRRYEDLVEDFRARIAAIEVEVKDAGFLPQEQVVRINLAQNSYTATFWKRAGADEAVRQVHSASNAMKRTINDIIARERAKIDRAILMQSLPGAPGAMDIISSLPTEESMMEFVKKELETSDPDLLATLLG